MGVAVGIDTQVVRFGAECHLHRHKVHMQMEGAIGAVAAVFQMVDLPVIVDFPWG
ncbi:hypothetical protein P872_21660 [Rhodonellum psychrophilum GCM71 = DSM 17998]|uniref:Uncharacterized protein n=1 Tax=Rhodonellum psychrophilum GCM71 = DSM 17998 TaxID=1123057 RepID=U5BX25_9BACT|nr:hypothetical protein P872_21660 [Rhodonellum psychrophilum GCM71 = DSM 17998]